MVKVYLGLFRVSVICIQGWFRVHLGLFRAGLVSFRVASRWAWGCLGLFSAWLMV